ncbi:---NA--- [Octopus vulgaris]|uniref:Mediator of RNA polymerase II transcription subunit 29 n=1 Tax=Octopus vulgaris TaxID=6645 RepID=A0AA36AWR6_OCTVU|nr:---NA--- [Octopus vulgaris]
MSKPLLNVYKQQNPDASCQLSKSTLGCVPKLNNRNNDSFEQDNGSDGSVGDRFRSPTIGERINETISENCQGSIAEPLNNSRVTDRSSNYVSTNSRTLYGKAYVDKNPSIPTAIESKQSEITTKRICEHKIEPSVEQTNRPDRLNIDNSRTEISLLNANTKEEMQSINQHFAPNILQNTLANKTAALPDVGLAESKLFPSDDPESSQTLHVVLLDVSNPNTYQKKREMKDFSSLTTAVPNLLEHKSDSQSIGKLNNVSKDQNEQFIRSGKCVKNIEHNNNSNNNFQRSEDNEKKFNGDLKPEVEYGNKTSFNMPPVFMNSSSTNSRGDNAGSSNFWQPDLVAKQDDQELEQVPINKKPRQMVKDQFSVCVPYPARTPFKRVLPNINLSIEPVTKKAAVSVTNKEAIVVKEYMECTTVGYQSVASGNFTAPQIGKNPGISGNLALRPNLVTSRVLSQENKAVMSNCILPQPDNLSQGLNFPWKEMHSQLIQEHTRQIQMKPVQNYVTMAKADQQIPCLVSRPNAFQCVCKQANQTDNFSHGNGENNLIQFRNQILWQQLQELHRKQIFECQLPSCHYSQNTQDSNASHVKLCNEIKNPINARSPVSDNNFIKKFQNLLPNLKASLRKVFRTSSEAVSQNIAGNHSEKMFIKDFQNSLEDLMGNLDRAEIYLQSAKEMQMQSFHDTWFTPYKCQDQSKTYSDYCNVAIKQIKVVQEIHDAMLFLDSFNNNDKELNN